MSSDLCQVPIHIHINMCRHICSVCMFVVRIMTGARLENPNLLFPACHFTYTWLASVSSPQVNMVMRLKETPTKNSNKNIGI